DVYKRQPTIAPLHGGAQSGGSGPVGTLPSTGLTPPAIPVIVAVSGAMIVGAALFLLPLLKRGRLRGGRRAGQKPHARA
ncbi:hypothetical protein, partial [Subtercola sp. RTI3]|uniref:hypothetical protein n=1 Tax=Subtercola sp. RTI3 TaxID=3048639 RepID=UPI002B23D6BD